MRSAPLRPPAPHTGTNRRGAARTLQLQVQVLPKSASTSTCRCCYCRCTAALAVVADGQLDSLFKRWRDTNTKYVTATGAGDGMVIAAGTSGERVVKNVKGDVALRRQH